MGHTLQYFRQPADVIEWVVPHLGTSPAETAPMRGEAEHAVCNPLRKLETNIPYAAPHRIFAFAVKKVGANKISFRARESERGPGFVLRCRLAGKSASDRLDGYFGSRENRRIPNSATKPCARKRNQRSYTSRGRRPRYTNLPSNKYPLFSPRAGQGGLFGISVLRERKVRFHESETK